MHLVSTLTSQHVADKNLVAAAIVQHLHLQTFQAVASRGFVSRKGILGRDWICHGTLTANFRAGCSSCSMSNSFVTNAVLIERAVMSCWHLHQLISQTTQYLDSWLTDLRQSELKVKLLEVKGGGARAPVPHSWRRHCFQALSYVQWARSSRAS